MSRMKSEVQGKANQYSFFITRKERGKGIGILDGTLERELASLPLGTVLYCIVLVLHALRLPFRCHCQLGIQQWLLDSACAS